MKVLCAAENTCAGCPLSNEERQVRDAVEASVQNQFAQYAWKSISELSVSQAMGWATIMRQELTEGHLGDTAVTPHVIEVIGRIADGKCVKISTI